MAKFRERIEARKLRGNGESIKTIAKKLGVSKGSVSLWCNDVLLTEEQKCELILSDKRGGAKGRLVANENKKKERFERLRKFNNLGKKQVGNISHRDLFIAGIALYWAEGNKKQRRLVFSNSDPKMICLWIKWLTDCAKVPLDMIYCSLGINQRHAYRSDDVEEYWSGVTGIPKTQFLKVSLKRVNSQKVYENPEEHFGTLNIFVRKSTNMNYLMLGLIDGLGNFEAGS